MASDDPRTREHWAAGLRTLCLRVLEKLGTATPHDVAGVLGVSVGAVAPRFTELKAAGRVRLCGKQGTRGRPRLIYRLPSDEEVGQLTLPL